MTVKADDGFGGTDTYAVTINLGDVNEQPDTPAKPTLAAVTGSSTSLAASWTKPGLNGGPDITGYKVQFRQGSGNWQNFTHDDTGVTATITGLIANTEYQVRVRAENGEADSDWSDPSDAVRTNAADMPIPPGLEVTLHLSDSDGEVGEDSGAVTVTATASPASAAAFTVTVSVSAVAPATDDDFTLSSNRVLSFAGNATESTGTVTIAPVDDGDAEANQVVTVSGLASIAGVTGPDDVTLTIIDDDLVRISGICNRTQRVEDRILVRLKYVHDFEGGCGDVNETHLAKLTLLDLRRNPSNESAFTLSLRPDDFEGLLNLVELDLADTRLGSLPAGVFDGLASLETLNLNKNRLRSLPAGVFAGLGSLETLRLQQNPSLRSPPYDELEALPNLTLLRVDREGRRKLQVAGGEGDAALEVAAGGSATYDVRLMSAPDSRGTAASPVRIGVSSDQAAGVVVTPASLRFTRENWFRSQTVTVRVLSTASGTVELEHEASGTTTDSQGQAQSNYDFDDYPLPAVTVRVLESDRGERALTARFASAPARHDGAKRVQVRVGFSEPVAESPENVGAHGVEVEGGAVTSVSPVGGNAPGGAGTRSVGGRTAGQQDREVVWEFEIEPDSDGDVTVSIAAGRPCDEPGAICTADGRALSEEISTTVAGPEDEPGPAALTARFARAPAEHDGKTFTLRIAFSETIRMSGRRLRSDVVSVSGGRATKAGPVNGGKNRWDLTVRPASLADVTVTLAAGAACDTPAAVCTADGQALSHTISTTVRGPVAVSVADARVREAAGATLDFAVSLSRAAAGPVSVTWATADGTATAGEDYRAGQGKLRFAPGRRRRRSRCRCWTTPMTRARRRCGSGSRRRRGRSSPTGWRRARSRTRTRCRRRGWRGSGARRAGRCWRRWASGCAAAGSRRRRWPAGGCRERTRRRWPRRRPPTSGRGQSGCRRAACRSARARRRCATWWRAARSAWRRRTPARRRRGPRSRAGAGRCGGAGRGRTSRAAPTAAS